MSDPQTDQPPIEQPLDQTSAPIHWEGNTDSD